MCSLFFFSFENIELASLFFRPLEQWRFWFFLKISVVKEVFVVGRRRGVMSAISWLCSYEPHYNKPFHCWFWIKFSLLISKIYRIEFVVESFTGLVFVQDVENEGPLYAAVHLSDGIWKLPNFSCNWIPRWFFESTTMNSHWARDVHLGNSFHINYWTTGCYWSHDRTLGQKAGSVELSPLCGCVVALMAYVMLTNEREWTPFGRGMSISSIKWMFEFQAVANLQTAYTRMNPIGCGNSSQPKGFSVNEPVGILIIILNYVDDSDDRVWTHSLVAWDWIQFLRWIHLCWNGCLI